jgi:hypothetical protein
MHNFRVYWISLYMFQTVFPSIIRSSRLYTQRHVYIIQVSWLHLSGHCSSISCPLACSQRSCMTYLMLCVQSWTPYDGRKDRPKHVEWYWINSKIVHLVGFTTEIYHNARVQWTSIMPTVREGLDKHLSPLPPYSALHPNGLNVSVLKYHKPFFSP